MGLTTDINRLASTKHVVANNPRADTFASDTTTKDSHIDRFDTESLFSSANDTDSAKPLDTSVYRYTQLPRRKSVHKRIGRLFLRISRMCSDAQCNAYAYQYGGGASELPAGGSPIEGSTSFYELPGSFPRAELEGLDMQESAARCYPTGMPYAHTAPEHLRDYYKANRNATLRRAAPVSVANLSQLPRLEVPQSRHCVPRLISDHSPLTPSSVSPITPVLDANSGHSQLSNSQLYLNAISPCTIPEQGQMFPHYGSWGHRLQQSPATPSTINSYGSSHATTPLSADPPSAHSSFQAWPQLRSEQMPPMYSQAYSTVHHNQSTNDAMATGISSWQSNINPQQYNISDALPIAHMQDYQPNGHVLSQLPNPSLQAQSCFEKQRQLAAAQQHPTSQQRRHTYNDAPPAYCPSVPDLQPPTLNPQQQYPPAVCQQCGKIFTGKYGPGNCKRHVQQTHGSMLDRAIHMCKVCMKMYNRADALRKHQWKKHRLEEARPNKRRDRGL